MDTCLHDAFSKKCLPNLTTEILRAGSIAFVCIVAMVVALFVAYVFCLREVQRPRLRVLSFFMIVSGLALSIPKVFDRILQPEKLADQHVAWDVLFAIGDILDHAGLMGVFYWDVCRESVLLVFALDPSGKARNLNLCFKSGLVSMFSRSYPRL